MSPPETSDLTILRADDAADLPPWAGRERLQRFLHETMKPYHDTFEDVGRGLDYAFSDDAGRGGFVIVAALDGRLAGAVVMLDTGMGGYIPEHLLLFVSVDPELRGHGIGGRLLDRVKRECKGSIKLHVEPDNPALRLYERAGFTNKYLEMRYDES